MKLGVERMLGSLARNAKANHWQQHRQIEVLKRELTAVKHGMGWLYL